MSWLVIEGFPVRVAEGSDWEDEPWGDIAPAFMGNMLSDVQARHLSKRVQTVELEEVDALALRLILRSPGALRCSGDWVEANFGVDEADFRASGVRVRPITATDAVLTFSLRQTRAVASPLLFSFDGDAPGASTFSRSGSVGPYTDSDGVLQSAAANVLRREWLWTQGNYGDYAPDTVAGLFEAERINLVSSDNFDSGWTSVGTPIITASISDPAGGTSAYRIANDPGSSEHKVLTVTFAGNGVKAVGFVVRESAMPASGTQQLKIRQTSGSAADKLVLDISAWVLGEPAVVASTGTYLGKRYVGDGYWLIVGLPTSITAAETNQAQVIPSSSGDAGAIDVYRVNAYNATSPGWSILDASETRSADLWYASFTHAPQAVSLYARFIEGGALASGTDAWLLRIGIAGSTDRAQIVGSSGFYVGQHLSGGSTSSSLLAAAPAFGDEVELLLTIGEDGTPVIQQSINGAAATTGTGGTPLAFAPAWNSPRVYVAPTDSGVQSVAPVISARIVRGVRTLDEMRALASARLHPRLAA